MELYKVIDELIVQVNEISKNNTKVKDSLSFLLLLSFFIFTPLIIISFLILFFNSIIHPFIINLYNFLIYKNIQLYSIDFKLNNFFAFSFSEIYKISIIFIVMVIILFILNTIKKIFFKKLPIYFFIGFYFIIFIIVIAVSYLNHIVFLIPLALLLIFFFIPLGSGKYFLILQNIKYFTEIAKNQFEIYPLNISKFNLIFKPIFILICLFLSSIGLMKLFNLSLNLSFVIIFSFFISLLLKNKNKNKVYYILKEFLIFTIFFLITIWANIKIENNIVKLLSLIITFQLSIDTFFKISNDISLLIKSESILYYYEYENIPKKKILVEVIEIKYIDEEITEHELVKQIILRQRLKLNNELSKLINLYKKNNYKNYSQLVENIEYSIETK